MPIFSARQERRGTETYPSGLDVPLDLEDPLLALFDGRRESLDLFTCQRCVTGVLLG